VNLVVHRLRKRAAALFGVVADWALFIGIVLIGGFGTSWYMVDQGSALTTTRHGPWQLWTNAARSDADPYTRAHFARSGALLLSTEVAETYVARTDSDGMRLHSSCDYSVEGRDLPREWWSLAVFDDGGRLISNPAGRHAFTSDTVAPNPNGTFSVTLGRDARSGNWLPTGGAGRLAAVFTILDLGLGISEKDQLVGDARLPVIKKGTCR
jgi:hypothetical protein